MCPICHRKQIEDATREAVANELIEKVVVALGDGSMTQAAGSEVLKMVMAHRVDQRVAELTNEMQLKITNAVLRTATAAGQNVAVSMAQQQIFDMEQ